MDTRDPHEVSVTLTVDRVVQGLRLMRAGCIPVPAPAFFG
jgi:hypothetical protein